MNVKLIRFVDKYVGVPICYFLYPLKLFDRKPQATQRILVIKLWALGDSVLTLPLIKALREHYPNSRIDVVVQERNKEVYTEIDYIDNVILLSKVWNINKYYDLVFDLEPYLRSSAILGLILGKMRVGFSDQDRSVLYNKSVKFRKDQHMTENYLDMLRVLGHEYDTKNLKKLQVAEKDKKVVREFLNKNKLKKFIGFCTGAAESSRDIRKWPRFAELGDILIRKGYKIVFVGSPNEREEIEEVIRNIKSKGNTINTAGKFNLKQTFFLIENCKYFISNDTGPMHIAAAQGVKTIGLFGPNTPILWAPLGEGNISIYHGKDVCPLSPCIKNDQGHMPDCINKSNRVICMKSISAEEVAKYVK
ncbi:glycosyltransferase family 9 protein [Candidatus Woesearchaeota archaeon]|nr:glycosyltransferase family 9 protein [Candidatus Woesearchaeota archaeon]